MKAPADHIPLPPPEAYADLEGIPVDLKKEEQLYVYWRSLAVPPAKAALRASFYPDHRWREFERSPRMKAALQHLNDTNEHDYRVTRSKIQALILEGIEIARRRDNAKVLIEGAKVLAEVSGLLATQPIVRNQSTLTVEVQTQNARNKALPHTLSMDELERMAGLQRTLVTPRPTSLIEHDG